MVGTKLHPLLQQVAVAFRGRNRFQFCLGRIESDSLARKGKQRFEQQVVVHGVRAGLRQLHAGLRQAATPIAQKKLIQENRRRNQPSRLPGTSQPGKGELADEEVPVGMASPFDIPGLLQVKRQPDMAGHHFVGNGPVINCGGWGLECRWQFGNAACRPLPPGKQYRRRRFPAGAP